MLAILRDVPDPDLEARASSLARDLGAGDLYGSALDLHEPRDRVDQLCLAVPVDAGQPDDLARANLERDPANALDVTIVSDVKVLDLEDQVTRSNGALLDPEEDL